MGINASNFINRNQCLITNYKPIYQVSFSGNTDAPRFLDLKDLPDPKPRTKIHVKNILLAAGGILGFFAAPVGMYDFHTQVGENISHEIHKEGSMSIPPDLVPENVVKVGEFIDGLAGSGLIELYYAVMLQLEAFNITKLALKNIKHKEIKPGELFGELNKRGLTGKGMKIAIIDTGVKPVGHIKKSHTTLFSPSDFSKPVKFDDYDGHGTSIAHIIAESCPDAELISIISLTEKTGKVISNSIDKLYKKAEKNQDLLTIENLRNASKPAIAELAGSVRKAVDEGAVVINISKDYENWLRKINAGKIESLSYRIICSNPFKKSAKVEKARILYYKAQNIENSRYFDKIDKNLKALYKPWYDALDYAHEKGVAVVVSAGNARTHATKGDSLGSISPLAIEDHPSLIVVASTDCDGVISPFSSEYNDKIQPTIAGIGSGELRTRGAARNCSLLAKILLPGFDQLKADLENQNPYGTSYSAPDISVLYLKMKEVDPSLKPEEAKEILKEVAAKAILSQQGGLMAVYQTLIEAQNYANSVCSSKSGNIKIDEKIKRLVGSGTLAGRHHRAIYNTEQRAIKKRNNKG